MKKIFSIIFSLLLLFVLTTVESCDDRPSNTSALDEQAHTEMNQQTLLKNQPLPAVTWSMERDNLIKLKKLQNDRSVNFYMYVFIEGSPQPIGYYLINKVSSVNSQLSNPQQIVHDWDKGCAVIESPSEDGSYGTNGDAVFGFTPEGICIQTNMKYITSTTPLHFNTPVNMLAVISTKEAKDILHHTKEIMKY